jgi:hypothetical protein
MATHTWNIMEAWQASFAIGGQRARSNYQSSLQASVSSTDGQADMHACLRRSLDVFAFASAHPLLLLSAILDRR